MHITGLTVDVQFCIVFLSAHTGLGEIEMAQAAQFTAEQIEAVTAALDSSRRMVNYYDTSAKRAQNAAMVAAGLQPIHNESSFSWDDQSRAQHERRIPAFESLLQIMQPTVADQAA